MIKNKIIRILISLTFILFPVNLMAADDTVEMLNKLDKEMMVFSKKIVRVDVGDTVFWKATDKGHNCQK